MALSAFSNVADYMTIDVDGHPQINCSRATREQMSAVQSIQVETFMDGRGKNARPVRRVKLTLHPKVNAALAIARMFGWIVDRREDVNALEEKLRQMTPEQRRQDAMELYERARARLLEDRQDREARGEVVIDSERCAASADPPRGV
jgi:hypothetical protein